MENRSASSVCTARRADRTVARPFFGHARCQTRAVEICNIASRHASRKCDRSAPDQHPLDAASTTCPNFWDCRENEARELRGASCDVVSAGDHPPRLFPRQSGSPGSAPGSPTPCSLAPAADNSFFASLPFFKQHNENNHHGSLPRTAI